MTLESPLRTECGGAGGKASVSRWLCRSARMLFISQDGSTEEDAERRGAAVSLQSRNAHVRTRYEHRAVHGRDCRCPCGRGRQSVEGALLLCTRCAERLGYRGADDGILAPAQ